MNRTWMVKCHVFTIYINILECSLKDYLCIWLNDAKTIQQGKDNLFSNGYQKFYLWVGKNQYPFSHTI